MAATEMAQDAAVKQPLALRINDFCALLGIGRTSAYRLIGARKITTINIAGRTLVPMSEVQRLLSEAFAAAANSAEPR